MSAPRQQGQVLILLLALWASLLGGLLVLFNLGQSVNAKQRLVNAADAAAYSAAVWEARSLNLQSYSNRAMVANEVAIAQMVSLRSWSAYMRQVVDRSATAFAVVPGLNAALRALQRIWAPLDNGLQRGLPPIEQFTSRWNVNVLMTAQRIAHEQAMPAAIDLSNRVLQDNLPEARLSAASTAQMARQTAVWRRFTRNFARRGDERARLRQVVLDARDGFSADRGWSVGVAPIAVLRKRGGTDLIDDEAWRGMDTLSLHTARLFGTSELPLAWGGAEARRRAPAARGWHGGSWRANRNASARAAAATRARNGYQGLPGYRDLAQLRAQHDVGLRWVIGAELPDTAIATSERALSGAALVLPGQPTEQVVAPRFAENRLSAVAAARVYFQRPAVRADGREEYPSLFSPYWQARLANATRVERATALGAGARDPYLVLP